MDKCRQRARLYNPIVVVIAARIACDLLLLAPCGIANTLTVQVKSSQHMLESYSGVVIAKG